MEKGEGEDCEAKGAFLARGACGLAQDSVRTEAGGGGGRGLIVGCGASGSSEGSES